jgi:Endoplasmic reticulum vesicle transporter
MRYPDFEIPEARFAYEVSPMAVIVSKKRQKWYSFITHILALIGGTFSIVGLVDAFFWKATSKRRGSRPAIVR